MNKTLLKIAGAAVPVILSVATNVASAGTVAPATTAQTATIAAGSFIVASFNTGMSAGVGLTYTESATAVAVQTGHTKGKTPFGGSSNGGSVKPCTSLSVSTTNGYQTAAPSATADGCS